MSSSGKGNWRAPFLKRWGLVIMDYCFCFKSSRIVVEELFDFEREGFVFFAGFLMLVLFNVEKRKMEDSKV